MFVNTVNVYVASNFDKDLTVNDIRLLLVYLETWYVIVMPVTTQQDPENTLFCNVCFVLIMFE